MSLEIEELREQLREQMVPQELRALDRLVSSLLCPEIEAVEAPHKYSPPKFILYDGKSNPLTHISHYQQMMSLWNQNDVFMCKLSEAFLARFVSNSRIPKGFDTLFNAWKNKNESLYEYARQYWEAYGDLEEDVCSEPLATLYFKQGLPSSHKLRQSLTKRPASNLKELRAWIEEQARVEDDAASVQVSVANDTVKASWQQRA
ncbi:uncharacterized protein LOC114279553 [Camellia sinensis]|uniref:uncharacterized protein LOC114279553 n=1 Tax=Camellia sinensis TaxID=4442 RepID=UPI001035F4B4|nr:uncharacterized protein LOC114279553 [Camellia sinensis]